jgi:hypothetical protein
MFVGSPHLFDPLEKGHGAMVTVAVALKTSVE